MHIHTLKRNSTPLSQASKANEDDHKVRIFTIWVSPETIEPHVGVHEGISMY
jgi:hypothetical protein